jgi:hypothetical protein
MSLTFFVRADPAEFLKYNFNVKEGDIHIQWMAGAQTNISYNALGKVKRIRENYPGADELLYTNTGALFWN